jgi:plastocyanin
MKKLLPLIFLLVAANAHAEDYKLVIKDHRFQPSEIGIPSGTKIKLVVENQDGTPEEFDSHDLNREKIISGNSSATIYIGPLPAGRYTFIGEFHATTAIGAVIVR